MVDSSISLDSLKTSAVEYVKGVTLNVDGSYAIKQSKTLKELMAYFMQWWKLVQSLVNSSADGDNTVLNQTLNDDGTKDLVATVAKNAAKDCLGHVTRAGMTCPQCGKQAKSLTSGGFCSTKCALEYITKMLTPLTQTPNEKYKEYFEVLDKITKILDHTTLLLNALIGIPDIIRELSEIPEPYKDWVQLKINEGFCKLYACVNKLMIKKSELIRSLLKPIKGGVIKKPIKTLFAPIATLLDLIDKSKKIYNDAFKTAQAAINQFSVNSGLILEGESFAFMATPRSFISPLPDTNSDSGKVLVNLPGGGGAGELEKIKAQMPSALQNINFESIDAFIKGLFPPLTAADFYLEPELFDVRYMFSDQSKLVLQVRQQMEDFFTYQYDYLPKFENMIPVKKTTYVGLDGEENEVWLPNMGYTWFLLGLLDSWAPHSQALVGSLINPNV